MSAHRVAHLDDLERVGVEGSGDEFALSWLPVRATLGIRAFGTNAYVGDAVGDHVVEPHTELGSGHEELYFVARGRARFTFADGQVVDAPACVEALAQNADAAFAALAEAARLRPETAEWAATDDDFAALREDPRFAPYRIDR